MFLWGLTTIGRSSKTTSFMAMTLLQSSLAWSLTLWPSVTFICSGIPCSCQLYCYGQPGPGRFWTTEAGGISSSTMDADDSFMKAYMQSSIKRQLDGALSLKFPWKDDHPPLPSNFSICEKRTRCLAQRLAKTPELLQMYGKILSDQEKKGFIEKVNDFKTHLAHYIPHRPVRKDSDTTPIRIVYDCSCKQSSQHPSLNDCLHIGPPFLNHLCAILLRFRLYVHAVSADIEKVFLHVQLDESDRDCSRFLWLSNPQDPSSPFQPYRFKVVLFGASCSPFMLNAAITFQLQQHPSPVSTRIFEEPIC